MSLTDKQFGLLQRSIDAIIDKLASLRLNLEIEYDFKSLVAFMEASGAFLNPTFNPKYCSQTKQSFWFRVLNDKGVTVGCHASKILRADDFFELMENERLWFDEGKREEYGKGEFRAELFRPMMMISGTISHAGAFWVEPSYRKRGLGVYLPYLGRSLNLRNHQMDYQTAIVLKPLADSHVPELAYGYTHVETCLRGYFPVTGREEEVSLCYMTQNECLEQLAQLPWHPQFPVALVREFKLAG